MSAALGVAFPQSALYALIHFEKAVTGLAQVCNVDNGDNGRLVALLVIDIEITPRHVGLALFCGRSRISEKIAVALARALGRNQEEACSEKGKLVIGSLFHSSAVVSINQ